MGIAVGFFCFVISKLRYRYIRFGSRNLESPTSGFDIEPKSLSDSAIEFSNPGNMVIASKIYFVTVTESELALGILNKTTEKKLICSFTAAILDYRKQLKMPKRCLMVASTYSEITTVLLLTPSGSAAVVKRSAWG
jgi:hypothetical protein